MAADVAHEVFPTHCGNREVSTDVFGEGRLVLREPQR